MHPAPGGSCIKAADKVADHGLAPFRFRQAGGLEQVIQSDHAMRYQKPRQEPFRILISLRTSRRADDHRNDDRDIFLVLSVPVLPLDVPMDPPGMDGPAQGTGNPAAIQVELMNKIG